MEARSGETASNQAAEEIAPVGQFIVIVIALFDYYDFYDILKVETLLGKRRSFYPLLSHYRQLLVQSSANNDIILTYIGQPCLMRIDIDLPGPGFFLTFKLSLPQQ